MKQIVLLLVILCVQVSFAQYTFKYESEITQLKEIEVENQSAKIPKNGCYHSKTYLTNLGDTLTIIPKIALIVKNADEIDRIIGQFGESL